MRSGTRTLQPPSFGSIHSAPRASLNRKRHIEEKFGVAKLVSRKTIFPSLQEERIELRGKVHIS
jgi:hypothetical protein